MSSKKVSIIAIVALLLLMAFVWWQSTQTVEAPVVVTPQEQGSVQGATTATGKDGVADDATLYSTTDVALHATKTSCWASVNGTVYDLTTWVAESSVSAVCGKDATATLAEQQEALGGFTIGVLVEQN